MKMGGWDASSYQKKCKEKLFACTLFTSSKSHINSTCVIAGCVSSTVGWCLVCAAHPRPQPGHLALHVSVQGAEI